MVVLEALPELAEIAAEADGMRAMLAGLQAWDDLSSAVEAQVARAATLLGQLRGRADEVERAGGEETKRQFIDLLVWGIRVDTTGESRQKEATLTIVYAFADLHAVDATTNRRGRTPGRG